MPELYLKLHEWHYNESNLITLAEHKKSEAAETTPRRGWIYSGGFKTFTMSKILTQIDDVGQSIDGSKISDIPGGQNSLWHQDNIIKWAANDLYLMETEFRHFCSVWTETETQTQVPQLDLNEWLSSFRLLMSPVYY